jgi:hypothetical protein
VNRIEEIESYKKLLHFYGFSECIDTVGTYSKKDNLYYKEIKPDQYISLSLNGIYSEMPYDKNDKKYFVVSNNFNTGKKDLEGFDLWLSVYNCFREIGVKKPIHILSIRLSAHHWVDDVLPFFLELSKYGER